MSYQSLIVFSHLRWEFVTQRPQHLISRFARKHRVIFVEDPIVWSGDEQPGTAKIIPINDRITVLQPRLDSSDKQFNAQLGALVMQEMTKLQLTNPLYWFFSPAFVETLPHLPPPALIVYDCMDELSHFKGAPPQLIDQEKQLLAKADVVFTGGKSLFESKQRFHSRVYCFPSSVDRAHFVQALNPDTAIPADIQNLPDPIAGYYGVIDERLDTELLARVAQQLPQVTFLMIGPVVKISAEDLPQEKNIVYTGSKPYSELPNYLKAIDVAMMPFALNAATEFISPTKTLEFMAAHKPIVSTPIRDVVRDYNHVVAIANSPQQFADAITSYLNESPEQKQHRQKQQASILDQTSWDNTVTQMEQILQQINHQR